MSTWSLSFCILIVHSSTHLGGECPYRAPTHVNDSKEVLAYFLIANDV